jgi:hypothetical protein
MTDGAVPADKFKVFVLQDMSLIHERDATSQRFNVRFEWRRRADRAASALAPPLQFHP